MDLAKLDRSHPRKVVEYSLIATKTRNAWLLAEVTHPHDIEDFGIEEGLSGPDLKSAFVKSIEDDWNFLELGEFEFEICNEDKVSEVEWNFYVKTWNLNGIQKKAGGRPLQIDYLETVVFENGLWWLAPEGDTD